MTLLIFGILFESSPSIVQNMLRQLLRDRIRSLLVLCRSPFIFTLQCQHTPSRHLPVKEYPVVGVSLHIYNSYTLRSIQVCFLDTHLLTSFQLPSVSTFQHLSGNTPALSFETVTEADPTCVSLWFSAATFMHSRKCNRH